MRDMVLILDFDPDFSRMIARKLRSERIYCRIVPRHTGLEEVQEMNPSGLILSGGTKGRGEDRQQMLDKRLLDLGLPVLAMGACARTLCELAGGQRLDEQVTSQASTVTYLDIPLFQGLMPGERWLEHVHPLCLPEGWVAAAWANDFVIGFAHAQRSLYGIQFQIERNDPDGMAILLNFALQVCGCTTWWETEAFIDRAISEIERMAQGQAVLCAVSGGLDSAVCAVLASRAIGERAHPVLVDTGLLRQNELEGIITLFHEQIRLPLRVLDAKDRVLEALEGIVDGQAKRAAVRAVYQDVISQEAERMGGLSLLIQGTNYSDIIREGQPETPEMETCGMMRIVEPLCELFKDEVRRVGEVLELPPELLNRQPFPAAGLGLRTMGPVTQPVLDMLGAADAILAQEVVASGLDRKLSRFFVIHSPLPTGAGEGDGLILRAMALSQANAQPARLPYDLLERVVSRITEEVPGVRRVMYDLTYSRQEGVEWQ